MTVAGAIATSTRAAEPDLRRSSMPDRPTGPIAWTATPGSLERLALRNAWLMLITCGGYYFWGKIALRQRIWASVTLEGRPFKYTGPVRDILIPALAAGGVLLVLAATLLILKLLAIPTPTPKPSLWRLLVTVPLIFLIGLRLWRARAYVLNHSVWSSRRSELHGNPVPYALLHFLTMLAMPVTLGWVLPWRQAAMARRIWGATEIAGRRFTSECRLGPLYRRFLPVWLGAIAIYLTAVIIIGLTMGPKIVVAHRTWTVPALNAHDIRILIVIALASLFAATALLAWYKARWLTELVNGMRIDGARMTLRLSSPAFVRLAVENMALRLFTLGLLSGLAEVRLTRHLVERMAILDPMRPRQPGLH
jgi:uncharacterized membrane protein YjgN (DUF898 family)